MHFLEWIVIIITMALVHDVITMDEMKTLFCTSILSLLKMIGRQRSLRFI